MSIEKFDTERLRKLPIINVAERLGLKVSKAKAVCCFHDDHRPSLCFDVRRNRFCCFSCGMHGDVITLVMNVTHKPFVEACRWLADDNNILPTRICTDTTRVKAVPPTDVHHLSMLVAQPYLCPEARRWLYDERKIDPEVVRQLGLSSITTEVPMSSRLQGAWFNAPSLLIPYRDAEGNLLTVQARYLGPRTAESKQPRFQFPAGSACYLYNLPVLHDLKPGDDLYLAEGPSDVMALLTAGQKAIGVPSATLMTTHNYSLLAAAISPLRPKPILHCYPDNDRAGEQLYQQLMTVANNLGCVLIRHELPEGCKDFADSWKMYKCINV